MPDIKLSQRAEEAAAKLAAQYRDGLAMFRPVSPRMQGARENWPDQVGAMECQATEIMLDGGNRSSKSVTAAAIIASIIRDMPITTFDGKQVHCRRPHQRNRPLLIWIIGLKLDHIGQTIYRLLFQPGAYKIIRDKETGIWRAWTPWVKDDAARWNETQDSYPLVPESEVEKFNWESEGERIFTSIRMKNGVTICAYASSGEVKMGEPVDVIWIDEKLWFSSYYAEYRSRLIDRMGHLYWSTMPRPECTAWRSLKEAAQEQQDEIARGERPKEKLHIKRFLFTMSGNPFHNKVAIEQYRESSIGKDEVAVRDEGEDIGGRFLCYPHYDEDLHSVEHHKDKLYSVLEANAFIPPPNWTHELILDPGSVKPGLLFAAVPPEELWANPQRPYFVPYHEIYLPSVDANMLAKKIAECMAIWGINWFRRLIIDGQAGRQRAMGFGIRVSQNYTRAFEEHKVTSWETGSEFVVGSPDFEV